MSAKKPAALLYSAVWCERSRALERFLEGSGISLEVREPDKSEEYLNELKAATGGPAVVPVLVTPEGIVLLDPSDEEAARALGIPGPTSITLWDVAILGAGPAGMTGAIYCARENLKVLLLEKSLAGGQAALTEAIENYPGFPEPVSGIDLTAGMRTQALKFGATLSEGEEVTGIAADKGAFLISTNLGTRRARSVMVATGASYRRLNVPGEEKLLGRGVSFCATCDAPFYRGMSICVVGGGNSALQETLHLSQFASRITLLVASERLSASPVLRERVLAHPNVKILFSHRVVEILGEKGVEGVRVTDEKSGKVEQLTCRGIFVFIGQRPNTAFLKGFLELCPLGFVRTKPGTFETGVPGVFAVGDVRENSSKQISSAVGEATAASFMVRKYLAGNRRGCSL